MFPIRKPNKKIENQCFQWENPKNLRNTNVFLKKHWKNQKTYGILTFSLNNIETTRKNIRQTKKNKETKGHRTKKPKKTVETPKQPKNSKKWTR